MKFRKRPIQVEAFRYLIDTMPDWFMDKVTSNEIILYSYIYAYPDEAYCLIETLEGTMRAVKGDYIIRGVKGEVYPCKPDIFNLTYEIIS